MASEYRRLLDPRSLNSNMIQQRTEIFDAGAYNHLQVQTRILKPATGGGNIIIQHAATMDDDAFMDLITIPIGNTSTSPDFDSANDFLRYIRWRTDAITGGPATVMIDIIAKE